MKTVWLVVLVGVLSCSAFGQLWRSGGGGIVGAKILSVMDYGAVGNGVANDSAAFARAIDASVSGGVEAASGGIVYVPTGTYSITGTLRIAKRFTRIVMSPFAVLVVPQGSTDTLFDVRSRDVSIDGGILRESGTPARNWIAVSITAGNVSEAAQWVRIKGMAVAFAGVGLNLAADSVAGGGGAGHINGNIFEGIWFDDCRTFIRTRMASGCAIDNNSFIGVQGQASASTVFGIDSLVGNSNSFINCQFWDMPVGSHSVIRSSANRTVFWSGNIQESATYTNASITTVAVGSTVNGDVSWNGAAQFDGSLVIGRSGSSVLNRTLSLWNNGATAEQVGVYVQSATTDGAYIAANKRGTTGDSTAAIKTNVGIGGVKFGGWDGSQYATGASIVAASVEDWDAGNHGTILKFQTVGSGSTSMVARAWLMNNGRWGFGSSCYDPDSLVTVAEGVNFRRGIKAAAIPTYADNAAATAGGLPVGSFYRTSTGVLMVRY